MKLNIVLPAYNERNNVEILTKRFYKVFKKLKIDFELIYIVQGTDGANEQLLKLKKGGYSKIRVYYYKDPLGVGPAFKEGFARISSDATHVLTMDSDLNHQPEELPRFINKMNEGNVDIVIGSRKISGGKMIIHNDQYLWIKKIISFSVNRLLPLIFGLNIKDMTSGYRLFKADVIRTIGNKIRSKNFEVYPEILILSKLYGFKMEEVPIVFKSRLSGKSKLNFIAAGFGYIKLFIRTITDNTIKK